jgi:hypothetical protein
VRQWAVANDVELSFSAPYYHQQNGSVERANRSLLRKLRKFTKGGTLDWKVWLDRAVKAVNLSYNRSIETCPYICMYEQRPKIAWLENLKKGRAEFNFEKFRLRQNQALERKKWEIENPYAHKPTSLDVNERVMCSKGRESNPLAYFWEDGYIIVEKLNHNVYKVKKGTRVLTRHAKHLRRDKISVGG